MQVDDDATHFEVLSISDPSIYRDMKGVKLTSQLKAIKVGDLLTWADLQQLDETKMIELVDFKTVKSTPRLP